MLLSEPSGLMLASSGKPSTIERAQGGGTRGRGAAQAHLHPPAPVGHPAQTLQPDQGAELGRESGSRTLQLLGAVGITASKKISDRVASSLQAAPGAAVEAKDPQETGPFGANAVATAHRLGDPPVGPLGNGP